MAKFKLLVGMYQGPDMRKPVDEVTGRRPTRTYRAPATVESDLDLVKIGGFNKFRLIENRGARTLKTPIPPAPEVTTDNEEETAAEVPSTTEEGLTEAELKVMNINELRAYAAEKGIDHSKLKTKAAIIEAIVSQAQATAEQTEEEEEEEEKVEDDDIEE